MQDPQAQEDIDIRRLKDTQDTLVDPHKDPHIQDRYKNLNIYFTLPQKMFRPFAEFADGMMLQHLLKTFNFNLKFIWN